MSKKVKVISIISFLIVFAGLMVFMFSGDNFEIVKSLFRDDLSEAQFKELLQSFGIKGSITLSILSMLQVVLTFLPAEPVQVLSGIGYGFFHDFAICLVGVFVGNTAIYIMFKLFGDKLTNYFKKNIDLDFDKMRNSKMIALIVFILYFLPAIPYGLICFFSASLQIKYPRYILLTTLGSIPSIFIGVGIGHLAMASSWIISAVVFVVLVALLIVIGVKRKTIFKKMNDFIHKLNKPNSTDTVVKKGNPFVMFFCGIIIRLYLRSKVKFKFEKTEKIEGPAILLANHGCFFDFMFVTTMLKKTNLNFMVARLYFYKKLFAKFLRSCGNFPKSMFSTDLENVKNSFRVLQSGAVLGLMPEARLSTVGKFEDIQDTTIKFIKKMGVPVYVIKLNGTYFAKPKWGDKFRKGAVVHAHLDLVVDGEKIKTITEPELKTVIESAIDYNEFKWLETQPQIHYKSKTIAEGLENILFKCPVCGKELTIKTSKNSVYCTACNLKTTVTDRYAFETGTPFTNFAEWYDWQKAEFKKEIESTPNYMLTEKVTLYHGSKDGKDFVTQTGEGVCTLTIDGLTYQGTDEGETVNKIFPMSIMYRLLFGAGEDFEIYDGKEIYYFVPQDTRSCVKWYIASEVLKDLSLNK